MTHPQVPPNNPLETVAEILHTTTCKKNHPEDCLWYTERSWYGERHVAYFCRSTQLLTEVPYSVSEVIKFLWQLDRLKSIN